MGEFARLMKFKLMPHVSVGLRVEKLQLELWLRRLWKKRIISTDFPLISKGRILFLLFFLLRHLNRPISAASLCLVFRFLALYNFYKSQNRVGCLSVRQVFFIFFGFPGCFYYSLHPLFLLLFSFSPSFSSSISPFHFLLSLSSFSLNEQGRIHGQ